MATQDEIIQSLYRSFSAYLLSVNPTIEVGSVEYSAIDGWSMSFASSIGGAIEGGSSGIIPTDFLKKAGDSMIGKLSANYGFEAGAKNGIASLKVEDVGDLTFIRALSDLDIVGKKILYSGNELISVSADNNVVLGSGLLTGGFSFSGKSIFDVLSINIGDGKLLVDQGGASIDGNKIYHAGNSNIKTVDWKANNLNIFGLSTLNGGLNVSGSTSFTGGFVFKFNESTPVIASSLTGSLEIHKDTFIKNNSKIFLDSKNSCIFGATTGNLTVEAGNLLLLKAGENGGIRLMSSLFNDNGQVELISKSGKVNFLRGVDLGISDISVLSSVSYGVNAQDKGIEVLNFMKFKNRNTGIVSFSNNNIGFLLNTSTTLGVILEDGFVKFDVFSTNDNERFMFTNDVLSTSRFTIYNSASNATATYLGDKILYLGDNGDSTNLIGHSFENTNLGIKINGDLIADGSMIKSLSFSEGLSGSGLGIDFIKNTITSDFLVVRKKLRVLEFEIQKTTNTNGNLFISSACSGDYVTEII